MSDKNIRGAHPLPDGSSKVQQHHAEGSSTTAIMQRHLRSPNRNMPPVSGALQSSIQPRFEYVSSLSYHDMLNVVSKTRQIFERLPSRTRSKFLNDPGQMLAFLEDPANRKEALKLGLVMPTDAEFEAASQAAEDKRLAEAAKLAEAPKADPEAQPSFTPPGKTKGGSDGG